MEEMSVQTGSQLLSELQVWSMLSNAFIPNAIFFASCAFLIWVGFRFSSRIYYEGNVNVIGKLFTTAFCLSVAIFTFGTMSQGAGWAEGYANVFSVMAESQPISENAENFIKMADGKLNIVQWVFIVSVVVMQLTQIWVKKPE
tara:strand:- start:209 stop:637 length:429 start_codon:yes stop_codon:yes gene_type:complete